MLVFITVKPTSSYAVVFQSQKRVQYYLPALEIHRIRGAAEPTCHNKGSLEHINKKYCILIKVWCKSSLPEQNQGYARVETFRFSLHRHFLRFTSDYFTELLSHITCSNRFVIYYIFCLYYFRKK